jgi:hypothetical protein
MVIKSEPSRATHFNVLTRYGMLVQKPPDSGGLQVRFINSDVTQDHVCTPVETLLCIETNEHDIVYKGI